jgi:hypothetical protein
LIVTNNGRKMQLPNANNPPTPSMLHYSILKIWVELQNATTRLPIYDASVDADRSRWERTSAA